MPIKVSIVEDDHATRQGFRRILQHAEAVECIGAYSSGEEALAEIPKALPDVVLMDINLPIRSGIECVAELKRQFPQLLFLMLTTYDDSRLIFDSLRAGASGYLLKRSAPEELLPAIMDVSRGGSPMSMKIARMVVSHFHQIPQPTKDVDKLTKRELEILTLLARGLPYKQIAHQLSISPSTVHGHLHSIYAKMHVQSRTEAVVKFLGK